MKSLVDVKYLVEALVARAAELATPAAILFGAGLLVASCGSGQATSAAEGAHEHDSAPPPASAKSGEAPPAVELNATQLTAIKIEPVGWYAFPVDQETVGTIDFDGDVSVQVWPNYQGTVLEMRVALGADVQQEEPLYTIKSPDLIQAESTLIGAAATFALTNKELARAKSLEGSNGGVSEREVEQATSDQQTAEGALKAARDAVRVFGKTEAEIDQLIATRQIDPALVVRSPLAGQVTAKSAQPGFLVQPGTPPAPYAVADVALKWMLATVPESTVGVYHLGQPVQVNVMAYPGQVFTGRVSKIYETVDPSTHRLIVRSEIADPKNALRPGMLANFLIQVRTPVEGPAVPANGVVREADGTMTAWVTTDRRHFEQRVIQTGLRRDGRVQILEGLQPGELVVSDGAVFVSNILQAS